MRMSKSVAGFFRLVAVMAIVFIFYAAPALGTSASDTIYHAINPNKCVQQTITWTTTDASEVLTIPNARYWGCPTAWLVTWTTAAPYADAETIYIVKSEFSVGQTYGATTVYRDEGITAGCVSDAVCDVIWYWK